MESSRCFQCKFPDYGFQVVFIPNTVLPVCSGIRFHVQHESDGRAEPEGSVNKGSWMKVTVHGYARMPCSTRMTERERILSASWMLRL